jgi:hypothetical protein
MVASVAIDSDSDVVVVEDCGVVVVEDVQDARMMEINNE